MDECPVNSIEHPFLTEGEHDPAAQGHRGSSPQRDFRPFDLQMPVFSKPSASGTGGGDDGHDDHSSPYSNLPPASRSSPTLDFALSFGESQAANALVAFGAGWPASSPTTQFADTSFAQLQTTVLQTTICPADVRPRAAQTFTLFPELALHYDSGSPPSYEAATGDYDSLAPDDLIMSFSTRIEDGEDVETHPDVYEAKPLAHGQWHPNKTPSSSFSAYPSYAGTFVGSEYEYNGGTAHHDPWRTISGFGQPRRRPPLSRDSSFAETSASFVTARHLSPSPSLVTLDNSPMTLDLPYTPRFGHSPTASNVEPVLDTIGYGCEADDPYEVDEDATVSMDSPEQVFHLLTDPIDGTELTDVGSDDEDYMDKDEKEKEDEEWSRSPTRQRQNHRRTFKMALWDTINDSAFCHLVRWADDGLSGLIPDKKQFQSSKAMRAITDARDFGGFVRQLHMWGFSRFKVAEFGDRSCGFFHQNFQRNRLDLLEDMKRKGETKVTRPTPKRKRKATPRAKRSKPTSVSDDVGPKPTPTRKRTPRPRKTTTPKSKLGNKTSGTVTDVSNQRGPSPPIKDFSHQDLESLLASSARSLRTRSSHPSGRIVHQQSAERDLPLPTPRKRGKASIEDFNDRSSSVLSTPSPATPSDALVPSKKVASSGSAKRRAPTPDPFSGPSKPAKIPKSGSKAALA